MNSAQFDQVPDELLLRILKWIVPDHPIMDLRTSEARMIRVGHVRPSADHSANIVLPVHCEPMEWMSNYRNGLEGCVVAPSEYGIVLVQICRRWRRVAMELRNGWAAFDPAAFDVRHWQNASDYPNTSLQLSCDPLRISNLKHLSWRLISKRFIPNAAKFLIDKLSPLQLVSVDDRHFGLIQWLASHPAKEIATWERMHTVRFAVPADFEEAKAISNLLGRLPCLESCWLLFWPGDLLGIISDLGGFPRSLKTLGLVKWLDVEREDYNVNLRFIDEAAPFLETLILKSTFIGSFSSGFHHLRELTVWMSQLHQPFHTLLNWEEEFINVASLLTSTPLAMRGRLSTLRVIFETDSDALVSPELRFNGGFASRFLTMLRDCHSLTALELQVGRIKLGHLALILKVAGGKLETLRVGHMFDVALGDVDVAWHNNTMGEFCVLNREFLDSSTACSDLDRLLEIENEETIFMNIAQDFLFWPSSDEINDLDVELWKARARRVLSFYCPRIQWFQLWHYTGAVHHGWSESLTSY